MLQAEILLIQMGEHDDHNRTLKHKMQELSKELNEKTYTDEPTAIQIKLALIEAQYAEYREDFTAALDSYQRQFR